MPAARKKIPKAIEHAVREQCGQACANPACRVWSTATHELHHIDGDRSRSVLENLILLCGSCHNQVGSITNEATVMLWKRMAEHGYLKPPAGENPNVPPKGGTLKMRDNHGIAGGTVNIGALHIKREKGGKTPPIPGTIGADDDMRTYADYLVKRYIDWRKKGQRIDRRRFQPGSAHSILSEGFGSPSSAMFIRAERFQDWVRQAQGKIDNTAWGRNNPHRNYHTWEEHLLQRHGKT